MSAVVAQALRLDDVGAASKQHEVYGVTRIKLGPLALPFPGNFLFLKYLPLVKRWGPYRELTAPEWERVLSPWLKLCSRTIGEATGKWFGAGVGPIPISCRHRHQLPQAGGLPAISRGLSASDTPGSV